MRRLAAWVLIVAMACSFGCGACSRAPKAPPEIPEKKMSMELRGILCSIVIDMTTGASGFRRVYTDEALAKSQHKTVTITQEDADWTVILDTVTKQAGIEWTWRQDDGEWVIWLHVSGEEWDPAALDF